MEMIKISVEVSVNLSEGTREFIKSLFTPANPCGCASTKEVEKASTKEVKKASTKEVEGAPIADKTIEEVREALSKKVTDHRAAIKQKLNDLGAPSVTKLDPSKYNELYEFLIAL